MIRRTALANGWGDGSPPICFNTKQSIQQTVFISNLSFVDVPVKGELFHIETILDGEKASFDYNILISFIYLLSAQILLASFGKPTVDLRENNDGRATKNSGPGLVIGHRFKQCLLCLGTGRKNPGPGANSPARRKGALCEFKGHMV